jgi:hypothetical protein
MHPPKIIKIVIRYKISLYMHFQGRYLYTHKLYSCLKIAIIGSIVYAWISSDSIAWHSTNFTSTCSESSRGASLRFCIFILINTVIILIKMMHLLPTPLEKNDLCFLHCLRIVLTISCTCFVSNYLFSLDTTFRYASRKIV